MPSDICVFCFPLVYEQTRVCGSIEEIVEVALLLHQLVEASLLDQVALPVREEARDHLIQHVESVAANDAFTTMGDHDDRLVVVLVHVRVDRVDDHHLVFPVQRSATHSLFTPTTSARP